MLDDNLIATLEQSLRQTRNAQHRLMARLREAENEAELLREEIEALENSARQTENAIDSILVTMRSGNRVLNGDKTMRVEGESQRQTPRSAENISKTIPARHQSVIRDSNEIQNRANNPVAYIGHGRGSSARGQIEPLSARFADRTITQACTMLLREAARPLHVNALFELLVEGGMVFKGKNPTISIAVSLTRNRRFRKVEPGTFDLMMREASQAAS